MDFATVKQLLSRYHRMLGATDCKIKRYLYSKINWKVRLIGIMGARGVGKTTLMLQYIKENYADPDKAFYFSLDDLWFNQYPVEELMEYLFNQGVEAVFIDEVHKLANWQQYIKNFYDSFPGLKIVYTGSAMLAIDHSKADLSRRQSLYRLNGLSLREYIEFEYGQKFQPVSLQELMEDHSRISFGITPSVKILKCFNDFLRAGYYPFYKDSDDDYYMRLADVVKIVIDTDVPSVEDVAFATLEKLKRLLMVVSSSLPFVPNISKLSEQLQNSREHTLKMLKTLDRAGLLRCLYTPAKSYKHLSGPEKVFVDNPNLMYALSPNVTQGTVRETFFANQTSVDHTVEIPKDGDFLIDGRYTFEVGGMKKSYRQIADMPDSLLAVDDMENGIGNKIPLWMFGFLY